MLTTENSGELIAGVAKKEHDMTQESTARVTVLRAFFVGNVRHEVGDEVTVSSSLARELLASNKAAPVVEKQEVPAPVKEKKNA